MRKPRAFTLMEMLIAVTIFAVIVVSIYSAFQSGIFGYRNIEDALDLNQAAFSSLDRMDTDIRNCFSFSSDDNKFSGDSGNISFLTLANIYEANRIKKSFAFVSYSVKDNKLIRLCRTGSAALNADSAISPEEMVENSGIKFEYGYVQSGRVVVYRNSWTDKKNLPSCVKVTLSAGSEAKARKVFERTIYLTAINEQKQ